jgi:carboxymethylenebutenolidase
MSRIPFYVEAAYSNPNIKALISYGGRSFTTLSESAAVPPQLLHVAGPEAPRRESCSIVPEAKTTTSEAQESHIREVQHF